MSDPRASEPHVLDQPWRVWASIAVIGIVAVGVLLGIVIIPVVQGRSAGLDAYTAICRALGLLPGSPAQLQPSDRTPPTPVSQVTWTPEVLQILARANPDRDRAKVLEVCVACHGEQGVSVAPEFPHLNGQSGAAIYKQLHDYQSGSRTHPLMTDVAKALEEPVTADVAAYYAGQPKRNPNPVTLGELPEAIVRLVELGIPAGTFRRARPVTGREQADQSKRRSWLSRVRTISLANCSSTRPASGATTSMAGCE